MKYFVWLLTHGNITAQKWAEDYSKKAGESVNPKQPLLKIELTAEDQLLSIDQLAIKYPLEEKKND